MAKKRSPNAYLSYTPESGTDVYHSLWVMNITQPISITSKSGQTAWQKYTYPQYSVVGAMTVAGRCSSQEDYQDLARFLREHQLTMIRNEEPFIRGSTYTTGYKRLLKLSIPSEAVLMRGWVGTFSLLKRGVFDPAPEYTFDLDVAFDQHSSDTLIGSHEIKQWFHHDPGDVFDEKGRPVDDPDTGIDTNTVIGPPKNKPGTGIGASI